MPPPRSPTTSARSLIVGALAVARPGSSASSTRRPWTFVARDRYAMHTECNMRVACKAVHR
eukprot:2101828-Alexandrium_andersonii.AAC.1